MKRVYLSGPISGYPDGNRAAFERARAEGRAQGLDVVCPVERSEADGFDQPRTLHMRRDIEDLLSCDAVVLLGGWRDSLGAKVEAIVALECGIPVCEEATGLGLTIEDHPWWHPHGEPRDEHG